MNQNDGICKGMDRKLYRASESGDAKLLDKVLREGTVHVFEEVTPGGDTALHTAAFYGHAELVIKLIQRASQNPEAGMQFLKAQNTGGNTALHVAAEGGFKKIVKLLVERDRGLACVKNKAGETPLFKASENGHVDIVDCLLDCTPPEFDRRVEGQTPLHVAVAKLHRGVTAKLLEKRRELVEKTDDFDRTALHILALVPNPGSWSTSTKAKFRMIGIMLLDKEISLIYKVDANGQSALHLGARVGNALLVEVILMYKTDCAQILDKDGRTALHLAVENASQVYERVGSAVKYIISSLALKRLINCPDEYGQTALDIAVQKVNEDKRLFLGIATYLKKHGASEKMFETETASSAPRDSTRRMDIVSIIAVLIATVAFAAAFTLPGGIDSQANPPVPFLIREPLFIVFVMLDSLAFCISIGTAVLLYFALSNREEDEFLISICFGGVLVALTCITLTFGAAIHLVVAFRDIWLVRIVWIMVFSLPLAVRFMSMRGKSHLFTQGTEFLVVFIKPFPVSILLMGLLAMVGWALLEGFCLTCI